jgi:hypothetical protein
MKKITMTHGKKKLSRKEMRGLAGGRVTCFNIAPGGACGGTAGCWLQSATRCCCAET